mgnify:CR=1 FL=1
MRRDGETRILLAIALGASLAGCASGSAPVPSDIPAGAAGALPAAEVLDTDLWMIPVARDTRGCVQYRMHSESRPSLAAVFYRTRAGDFSTIEEEAACT